MTSIRGFAICSLLAFVMTFTFGIAGAQIGTVQDTQAFLDGLLKDYEKNEASGSWRGNADRLQRAAEKKYMLGKYMEAAKDYDAAWQNLPDPSHFLMLGDIFFRSRLVAIKSGKAHGEKRNYCWRTDDFLKYGEERLDLDYQIGLKLASRLNRTQFLKGQVYRRANESEQCLRGMLASHSGESAPPCVAVRELEKCLGRPLLP